MPDVKESQVMSAVPSLSELHGTGGERLFDHERAVLLGSSCQRCGRTFFPQRAICPDCFTDGAMAERHLSRRGVVYASTVVRVPSSLGHKPPYAYGYVDLADEGVRVISRFIGSAPERFIPGKAVELAFEPVANDQFGPLLAWAFRLVDDA